MRPLVAVALTLCSLLTACKPEDTEPPVKWPRAVEPRLSGFSTWRACKRTLQAGRVVATADCGTPPFASLGCDDPINSVEKAKRLLLTQEHCTDVAIEALQGLALKDQSVLPDLAAAYYVSAQRDDRASDLVRALDALRGAPRSPQMLFNRALILQALGLNDHAIASWNEFLAIEHSQWADEARAHRDALLKKIDGDVLWNRHEEQLKEALSVGDVAEVRKLIAPFQRSAQRYLETLASRELDQAERLASELTRIGPDPYPLDVIKAWRRNPEKMRAAHAFYASVPRGSAPGYERAAAALEAAGSPLWLEARLQYATAVSNADFPRAVTLLEPIERQARKSGYLHLEARIRVTRAFYLLYQSRFLLSLRELQEALDLYRRLGDEESIADTHMTRVGTFRWAGATERACRESVIAMRSADRLVNLGRRHSLFGDSAQTALALGYPHVALLYQQAAVDLVDRRTAVANPDERRALDINRAAALRNRAEIKLHLNDPTASDDLNAAKELSDRLEPEVRRILGARIALVRGQSLRGRPAVAMFTSALDSTGALNHTARADLLSRRADARRSAGDVAGAKSDLYAAIREIELEETRMLDGRKRGEGEELWIPYFARFQDLYRRLIRQLLDEGAVDEAFIYTEKARAAEPLNLFAGRRLGEPFSVRQLQSTLPAGTFFVEYVLLDRDAIAWIVSRDRFEYITLPNVDRRQLEQWNKRIQRGVRFSLNDEFMAPLGEAYPVLIAPVLAAIKEKPQRIVFVPDGAIHGLPLAALYETTGKKRRYLVEQTIVQIAVSARLYVLSIDRDRELQSSPNRSILLAGDPAFDSQLPEARGLERLPEAQREVRDVREIYPDGKVLLPDEATPSRVLDLASRYGVLHIAAHSIPDADAPFRSVILLAKSPGDSGALYAEDLLTRFPKGRMHLVVLSSCSSSGGLPVGPEGVGPLVRPFIGARVPAVIGSLWPADDLTADDLFVSFHQHYRGGEDAATALRNAQLELLRSDNPALRAAKAWGAFQVIGHGSSPFALPTQQKEKPP